MELKEKQLRTLHPAEGHVLTQSADVPDNERIFSPLVCLGSKDSADNWREISIKEAEAIQERVRIEAEARQAEEERERKRRQLEAELAELNAAKS